MEKHKVVFKKCFVFIPYFCVLLFIITTLFPFYAKNLEKNIELNGVIEKTEFTQCNWRTLLDGSCQTSLETKWNQSFYGKKVLLKIRNQIMFSLFNTSPNNNVIIGKQKYLFEPDYIEYESNACMSDQNETVKNLIYKLGLLNELLSENDKELFIFITPSKTRYLKEKIPAKYNIKSSTSDMCVYEVFKRELNNSNLNYYDSIAFIDETTKIGRFQSDIFYKTGIHWSQPWGESAAADFAKFLNRASKYSSANVEVYEVESFEPYKHDIDLYESLNLLRQPHDHWYKTNVAKTSDQLDELLPNVFLRGGSFMGQSLAMLIRNDFFNEDVYLKIITTIPISFQICILCPVLTPMMN